MLWERFQAAVHNNDSLESAHKLAYLREAIRDPMTSPLLYRSSSSPTQYGDQPLIARYDRKHLIHKNYSLALANCNFITKGTEEEIRSLVDTAEHNLSGLKETGQGDLNTFLTSIFETKLPKRLHESWREYSKDSKTVPPIQDLLKFLKEKMDTLPEATHCAVAKMEHKLESRKPKTSIQAVQPASSTTCKGERHALYMSPSYKSMSTDARYSHVRSFNLCFTCLRSGYKTKDSCSISHCKKCSKPHHTTLHRNVPSSNATNFASCTPSPETPQDVATSNTIGTQLALQPTLQMTSRVILQAPSGKQTIARALLDPGASISLITNRIV